MISKWDEIVQASEEFEKTINVLEQRFSGGTNVTDITSFKNFASAWYKLGYYVGKWEASDDEKVGRDKER